MGKTYHLNSVLKSREYSTYPLNWQAIFGRNTPVAIEIGFGNGEFLVDWATKQPDWCFAGIEISMASIEKLSKRIHQAAIPNIVAVHEDARFTLRELFPDETISHVMMNFPDPWPKERHKHRRLLDENFVKILAMTLKTGCYYELVTDQQWYAVHAYGLFCESPLFDAREVEINPLRPVTTKYERKWQDMGRQSYRVLAQKTNPARISRLLENCEMPHAFVDKEVTPENLQKLVGFEYSDADKLFVIKDIWTDLQGSHYVLKMIAKDSDYQQHFLIGIYPQAEHRWLVKLEPTIQPYRTPAVKTAVWTIGQLLNS